MKKLFYALWLCAGCAGTETADEPETLVSDEAALGTRSKPTKVVVWQQNIEAMKAAHAPASRLTRAMAEQRLAPDIVVLQEAWPKVLCGDYRNPDAKGDVDLNNWKGSE